MTAMTAMTTTPKESNKFVSDGQPSRRSLRGRRILITRPLDPATELAAKLREQGAQPIVFPAIEIAGPNDSSMLSRQVAKLHEFDLAVFVSPTAVDYAFRAIRRWPTQLRAAVVGPASGQALLERGVADVVLPNGRFDSEGLLEHDQLQALHGQRIIIFRGGQGRELLGDTLISRGAQVEYAACYTRRLPEADPTAFLADWARLGIDAASFTSSEGLRNFAAMIGLEGRTRLARLPSFVSHPRIAMAARNCGFEEIHMTEAGDAALITALEAFFR